MKRQLGPLVYLSICILATPAAAQRIQTGAFVGEPVVPALTKEVRDLPPPDPTDGEEFNYEGARRYDHGRVSRDIRVSPRVSSLVAFQEGVPHPQGRAFDTPGINLLVGTNGFSPPDNTGDVGLNHFIRGENASVITIYDKTGAQLDQFALDSLSTGGVCGSGAGDPIIQYDELADRWILTEFATDLAQVDTLCVYVSQTPDPEAAYWHYTFNPGQSGTQDYPKYGIWPDAYYVGVNNGGWVLAMDRAAMLTGGPATMQEFNMGELPVFGFQLPLPASMEGAAPPAAEPGIFLRPRDTEVTGGACVVNPEPCDLMDIWELTIDWATPANSSLDQIASVEMADWDHTLCGTGSNWSCMPQQGSTQRIDPIREPIHYPLQYTNHGSRETVTGCFAEDWNGTDHAGVHWFALERTAGNPWSLENEGVLADTTFHRSVCSASMDSAGNIAVAYTLTGDTAHPSSTLR